MYRRGELTTQCIQDIEHVSKFISGYLHLANLHNTNFIISQYWEQTPTDIRSALEKLPHDEMSGLLLRYDWNEKIKEHGDDHDCDDVCWTSPNLSLPQEMTSSGELSPADLPLTWQHSQLESFMSLAASCQLDRLQFTQSCQQLAEYKANQLQTSSENTSDVPFVSHAMGEKKSHEVEVMAKYCAQLAYRNNIKQVVDLGSGKGYLSSTLALQHDLDVIGIDSQQGNTHGAMQRKTKLDKQYIGLVRREQDKALNPDEAKLSRRQAARQRRKQRLESQANSEDASEKGEDANGKIKNKSNYRALTALVGPDDRIEHLTADLFPADQPVLLTGLHTCGNLAVSMAKLFLRSDSCKAMVNVGCCYHQVDELFYKSPYKTSNKDDDNLVPHFPMSSLLKDKKFWLGRNCRMLSMQAMEKSATLGIGGGLDITLYWRALLQKILLDIHGYWRKDWIVGKISNKCANFHEYVRKAMKKLNVETQLPDEQISEYLQQYDKSRYQMAMFFQLRIALSPAIEAIILLDRCLYLLEQETTNVVMVKKLFDAVQSPRCYAVIATK